MHLTHPRITLRTKDRPRRIQKVDVMCRYVSCEPPCIVLAWASSTSNRAKLESRGMIQGCLSSYGRLAFWRRPPTLIQPSWPMMGRRFSIGDLDGIVLPPVKASNSTGKNACWVTLIANRRPALSYSELSLKTWTARVTSTQRRSPALRLQLSKNTLINESTLTNFCSDENLVNKAYSWT